MATLRDAINVPVTCLSVAKYLDTSSTIKHANRRCREQLESETEPETESEMPIRNRYPTKRLRLARFRPCSPSIQHMAEQLLTAANVSKLSPSYGTKSPVLERVIIPIEDDSTQHGRIYIPPRRMLPSPTSQHNHRTLL